MGRKDRIRREIAFQVERDFAPIWRSGSRDRLFVFVNQLRITNSNYPYDWTTFKSLLQSRDVFGDYETAKQNVIDLAAEEW